MSATDVVRRLLVLVPWLLERPGAHVDEAAAAVGSDRATVLADLSMLDLCGLPGRLGGDLFETELVGDRVLLRLAPAFERPLRPTQAEALRLVLSLDSVANVLGDELPGLAPAVARLRAAAGVPDDVQVLGGAADAHIDAIRSALDAGTTLELDYAGRGDRSPRPRVVDPWELLLHQGEWYLHAHDHDAGGLRTFRLDRLAGVRVTDDRVTVPAPATQLPPPSYTPGPDDVRVELEVSPAGSWVLDMMTVERVERREDGSARAVVATDVPSWVVRLVLAARGEVTVVGPPSVRAAVVEQAQRGLAAHREHESAAAD